MSEASSGARLAASIPVRVGETLPTARALEDAAVAAHAPPLAARLGAIDRQHDRGMSALCARYQERESRYDEEWPDPPRDICGVDAIALVIVAIGLAVVPASARFADRWETPSATSARVRSSVSMQPRRSSRLRSSYGGPSFPVRVRRSTRCL